MSEKQDKIEALKKQFSSFLKQKDDLFTDYLRVDGIIAYITNELNNLDPDWRKVEQSKQSVSQLNELKSIDK